MHWFYYVGRFIARILLFLFTSLRVVGRENVPARGPLLVVANHINMADPPVIAVSISLKTVFMAKEELFRHRLTGFIVRNFGAFPVRRGRLDRETFEHATHWLGRDIALVMFPEGSRSRDAQLQPAFPGSALIASRFGSPILPVGITGTEHIRGRFWWLRRPRITVSIGKLFYPPAADGRLTREERTRLTHSIMEHIAEILPSRYRGIYAEKVSHED